MIQFMFLAISFFVLLFFYLGTRVKLSTVLVALMLSIVLSFVSFTGFFQKTDGLPPRMLWLLLYMLLFVGYVYRSLNLGEINIRYLLAIHVLRIPVEFGLYKLYLQGELPCLMTFMGWNMDVLFGISALALLIYTFRSGKPIDVRLFQIWNIVGILFLTSIVGLAILSAASPFQLFAFDQPNRALLTFPYILLPGLIVPIVLLAHLLCLFPKKAG